MSLASVPTAPIRANNPPSLRPSHAHPLPAPRLLSPLAHATVTLTLTTPPPLHPNAADTALEEMLRLQVIERGISNPNLLAAMRSVPRERFFPPGTRDNVYADRPHPIGHSQTISQPYMVALMTERLRLQPQHNVLEIGTGSGYQTAVLSRLLSQGPGQIYTLERIKPLLDQAFERLLSLGLRNIHFLHADAPPAPGPGFPSPFDRILIAAAAPALPTQLLLTHLKDHGIAVLPIETDDPSDNSRPSHSQMLVRVTRQGDHLHTEDLCPCRFVKLLGPHGWPSAD